MPKIALISLGCAKNLVDSELILGRLAAAGYTITTDPAEAEVIIVNTCGFIGPAKEEAIETLLKTAAWKEKGRCRLLVGAGCLVQRYGQELVRELPEVDLWVTRGRYGELPSLLERAAEEKGFLASGPPELLGEGAWPRLRSTPPHRAYLRIADGCDNRCRYCVIPMLRGPYRSRPPEEILAEAEGLAAEGVQEITLIAQDTTAYGHDLPARPRLVDLLRRLLKIEGPRWWRLLYLHPTRVDEELIELLRGEPKLCRYLDLPLQHIVPHLLRAMGRPDDDAAIRRLIARLREEIPDLALRTSLMVGFPGETTADFRTLCAFVAETRFDWLGVFAYSREEGTPAASLPNQIPAKLKEERRRRLLLLQQEISRELLAARVGRVFPVLGEGPHPKRPGYFLARSEREAP
ncbi:MAG: 30S ribosomal protein S12 methylthiotransferase RimO [Firmicutes bacterium]|nr:30S ribosomal protein S12 methylthiotransferase RimO [Bacillota bacterium]